VTPNDPIETIEAVAEAYRTRWLVIERGEPVRALEPVLRGESRPDWIGPAVFTVPSADAGPPLLALHPVCVTADDDRCEGTA
jgi:hypothetical protein